MRVDILSVEKIDGRIRVSIKRSDGRVYASAEPTPAEWHALKRAGDEALGVGQGAAIPLLPARIVEAIVCDLSDRRGLRHEWEGIDDDVREEIKAEWTRIAARMVREAGPTVPRASVEALRATVEGWLDAPTACDAAEVLAMVDRLLADAAPAPTKGAT